MSFLFLALSSAFFVSLLTWITVQPSSSMILPSAHSIIKSRYVFPILRNKQPDEQDYNEDNDKPCECDSHLSQCRINSVDIGGRSKRDRLARYLVWNEKSYGHERHPPNEKPIPVHFILVQEVCKKQSYPDYRRYYSQWKHMITI